VSKNKVQLYKTKQPDMINAAAAATTTILLSTVNHFSPPEPAICNKLVPVLKLLLKILPYVCETCYMRYLIKWNVFLCHLYTAHTHWTIHTIQYTHTHTTVLLLFWNMSGTTRVSRYQKSKPGRLKPIWIYWSKR